MSFQAQLIVWAVVIGIFLAVRQFWLWYMKISRIVELLESIDQSLKALPAVQNLRRRA